ncbi:MAG TPA: DNA-binding protein WhiA [Erysipelothrix sp.]|nr:DNA-binding protein WhiA [Erysipelothrix sp.]
MSFASEVKQELCLLQLEDRNAMSQLAAMLQANSAVTLSQDPKIIASFSSMTIARRFSLLVKQLYQVSIEVKKITTNYLGRDSYQVEIVDRVKDILQDSGLYTDQGFHDSVAPSLLTRNDGIRCFLAGWFLAKGSVNSPKSANYHCEFRTEKKTQAELIARLLKRFNINGKVTKRRHEYIAYVKASDEVADVLRLLGAAQGLMEFENVRISRDFHNSLTRLDNCEVANEMKSIQAGSKQVEAIEKLIEYGRLEFMEQRIQQVAHLRLVYPEASLNELAGYYFDQQQVRISKSGMKHRLDKLVQAADRIDKERSS